MKKFKYDPHHLTPMKTSDLTSIIGLNASEKHLAAVTGDMVATVQLIASGKPAELDTSALLDAAKRRADAAAKVARLPRARRDAARRLVAQAEHLGLRAAGHGGSYSGETRRVVQWGDSAGAETSRRCTHNKTDAVHTVTLDPARVSLLIDSPLANFYLCDNLPLIALDADGGAVWVRCKGHRITAESGWVIGDARGCYHSTESRADAVAGWTLKLAAMEAEKTRREAAERARRASPEYKAERRTRLVARLCGGLTATLEDARALGFCTPGIEQFQRTHGIGNSAPLPVLARTGDPAAVRLALTVARKLSRSN